MAHTIIAYKMDTRMDTCALSAASVGYSTLKDRQKEVLVNFLFGNDVFAVLPTGYGKSLCYICLPKAMDVLHSTVGSIVVVVTPLIAIINDQVCYLLIIIIKI